MSQFRQHEKRAACHPVWFDEAFDVFAKTSHHPRQLSSVSQFWLGLHEKREVYHPDSRERHNFVFEVVVFESILLVMLLDFVLSS